MGKTASEETFVPAAGIGAFTRFYDLAIDIFSGERLLRQGMIEGVTGAAHDLESPRILEIGCGTGSLSIALAEALPDAEVVGVDIDPKALAIAESKSGAKNVKWLRGSATDLPVEHESFDIVAISLVMHHLMPPQQPAALEQARLALKAGGELHVIDFGRPRGLLPRLGSPVLALIDGRENTGPIFRGELPELIDAAGFVDRELKQRFGTPVGTIERFRTLR